MGLEIQYSCVDISEKKDSLFFLFTEPLSFCFALCERRTNEYLELRFITQNSWKQ